jgi:hypothetical protein
VHQHASECPDCAAELEIIRRTEKAYSALTRFEPTLHDPEGLTDAVMHRILSRQPGYRWTDLLAIPIPVQHALRFAAAALVCAFFSLSVSDAFKMSQMVERLSHVTLPATGQLDALVSSRAETTRLMSGRRVNEAGVLQLVQVLAASPQTTSMMDQFRTKYPGLFSITTDDGLDDREKFILATEGKAFLKDVEQLISMAEGTHAR